MPNLWIQNARVIDPAAKRDAVGDIFVRDGLFVDSLSAAEKKAAALPAQLTVPMILFFLPVLFVVILGPAIIKVQDIMARQ